MPAVRPVTVAEVASADALKEKGQPEVPLSEYSTLKPVSSGELSVQVRLTVVFVEAASASWDGAAGGILVMKVLLRERVELAVSVAR